MKTSRTKMVSLYNIRLIYTASTTLSFGQDRAGNIHSRFSINTEADATECPEDLEDCLSSVLYKLQNFIYYRVFCRKNN